MTFLKVCSALLVLSMIMLIFSRSEKELTSIISSVIYISVMIYAVSGVHTLINMLYASIAEIKIPYMTTFYQMLGILIVSSICVYVCETVGQKGIANVIEILSLIEIMTISFSLLKDFLFKILDMLE